MLHSIRSVHTHVFHVFSHTQLAHTTKIISQRWEINNENIFARTAPMYEQKHQTNKFTYMYDEKKNQAKKIRQQLNDTKPLLRSTLKLHMRTDTHNTLKPPSRICDREAIFMWLWNRSVNRFPICIVDTKNRFVCTYSKPNRVIFFQFVCVFYTYIYRFFRFPLLLVLLFCLCRFFCIFFIALHCLRQIHAFNCQNEWLFSPRSSVPRASA